MPPSSIIQEREISMREIDVKELTVKIKEACGKIAVYYNKDILQALKDGYLNEEDDKSKIALEMLLENADIARNENIPICQDTGMITVYLEVGQDVHFINGNVNEAVQKGVSEGYTDNYLRASVVNDPVIERKNTKDNTPAIIYTNIIPGDKVKVSIMAKGFGSENMSQIKMCKPAEGMNGVKKFVLDTIANAGPNACPPMIVGVGIGGTFDYSAVLSKKAMLRGLNTSNPNPIYKELEDSLLVEANKLRIGPMGLGGKTTVLKVLVETYPTHIAGMPVAVNICCHACRHTEFEL
jgi:fumarate hydratase subunit alpha